MAINRGFEGGFGGGSRSFHEQPAPRDSEPEALAAASKAARSKEADKTIVGLDRDVEKKQKLLFEYKKFPLGGGKLKAGERRPALEKDKSYYSVGKVDKRPFSKKLRSKSFLSSVYSLPRIYRYNFFMLILKFQYFLSFNSLRASV